MTDRDLLGPNAFIRYTDPMLRGTVAIFWGSLQDPGFHRQMKENRKIEDLILMFVSTSHNSLKKNKQLQEGDAWKLELNNQIAQFVRILRECLKQVSHVPPELSAKLDGYVERLVPTSEPPDNHYSAASPVTNGAGPSTSAAVMFASVSEMPLVKTVARLFGHTDQEVQSDLNSLRKTCTTKVCCQSTSLSIQKLI